MGIKKEKWRKLGYTGHGRNREYLKKKAIGKKNKIRTTGKD